MPAASSGVPWSSSSPRPRGPTTVDGIRPQHRGIAVEPARHHASPRSGLRRGVVPLVARPAHRRDRGVALSRPLRDVCARLGGPARAALHGALAQRRALLPRASFVEFCGVRSCACAARSRSSVVRFPLLAARYRAIDRGLRALVGMLCATLRGRGELLGALNSLRAC